MIQTFEKAMSESEWQDYNAAIVKATEEKHMAQEKYLREKWEAEQKEIKDAKKAEEERIGLEALKKVSINVSLLTFTILMLKQSSQVGSKRADSVSLDSHAAPLPYLHPILPLG